VLESWCGGRAARALLSNPVMPGKPSKLLIIIALAVPMSATANTRGSMSIGANVGGHDHPDDAGTKLGAGLEAEVRIGMLTMGGALGYDSYAPFDAPPLNATSIAGRAGIAVPFVRIHGRTSVDIAAISSLELGIHHYAVEGADNEFLFDGSTTYRGDSESTKFMGARAGAAMSIQAPGSSSGLIFKLELVGRRDFEAVDLEYFRVSCGGLFRDASDCSTPTHAMTRAGGSELGVTTSVGLSFGE
jgi:hypothetical protein